MSRIEIQQTGNWTGLSRAFLKSSGQLDQAAEEVARKSGKIGRKIMVKNIESGGSLVGAPFKPNTSATASRKGSNKPLIQTRSLINGIRPKQLGPKRVAIEVGKGHRSGINIAQLLEKGTSNAGRNRSVYIPARPFQAPVAKSDILKKEIEEMSERVVKRRISSLFSV